MAGPLDWLQLLLSNGDPEATGQAAASTAMAPNVLQYAQDVLSGNALKQSLQQHFSPVGPD
jgi:hypothetical protein